MTALRVHPAGDASRVRDTKASVCASWSRGYRQALADPRQAGRANAGAPEEVRQDRSRRLVSPSSWRARPPPNAARQRGRHQARLDFQVDAGAMGATRNCRPWQASTPTSSCSERAPGAPGPGSRRARALIVWQVARWYSGPTGSAPPLVTARRVRPALAEPANWRATRCTRWPRPRAASSSEACPAPSFPSPYGARRAWRRSSIPISSRVTACPSSRSRRCSSLVRHRSRVQDGAGRQHRLLLIFSARRPRAEGRTWRLVASGAWRGRRSRRWRDTWLAERRPLRLRRPEDLAVVRDRRRRRGRAHLVQPRARLSDPGGRNDFDTTTVFAPLTALTLLIVGLNALVEVAERRLLRWRPVDAQPARRLVTAA